MKQYSLAAFIVSLHSRASTLSSTEFQQQYQLFVYELFVSTEVAVGICFLAHRMRLDLRLREWQQPKG